MKTKNLLLIIAFCGVFLLGMFIGGYLTYVELQYSFERIMSNLRIEHFEIGFNETYIMDRFNETIQGWGE